MNNNSVIKPISAILIAALFLSFIFDLSIGSINNSTYAFLIICSALTVIVFRKNLPDTAVFYVMLTGMFLKLSYVVYTPVWCRQHDVIDFGAGEGHAAYMEYILAHKALPDFDPRSVWAFFQPPLHHGISAVWMWLNIRLGISDARMHKNVQVLPLVYMCLLAFIVYLICRELNMTSRATLVTMLIVSFHPIYILMSGSINNDALSVMLSVAAIYFAIRWYMEPTTGKILLLALAIGLAMFAKLSSVLVAFGIGAMMIYKLVCDTAYLRDKTKCVAYILQFVAFYVVVFPLGLWWTIRNKVMFDMPLNYIPEVGEAAEKTGFFASILDVGTRSPFLYMKSNGYEYDEYNLILATLKSSLFGEGNFANVSPMLTFYGWLLLALLVVVIVLWVIAAWRICVSMEAGPDRGIKILLAVTALSYIIGYILFALSGKNLSAMDFRYSAAAIAVLSIFLGLRCDRLCALGKLRSRNAIMIVSIAFAVVSAAFYIFVGLVAPY